MSNPINPVYSASNKDIVYRNWTYSGNTWSTAAVIQGSVTTSYNAPQISHDSANNRLFCVWLGYPQANKAYYSAKNGTGAWSPPVNFASASTSYSANSLFTVSYSADEGQVLVAWTEGSASPWTLKYVWLGSSVSYGYDGLDRLSSVSLSGGVIRRYSYDADGRRVRSYDGSSGNTRYVYSGLNVVYEVPDGGGAATLRFYLGSMQVAERMGNSVTYLHQDHLGSTRLETDASGSVVYSSGYQPFGVGEGEVGGSEEYRYTGKPEDDATGLYYYGARYYDPSIGRFITADSVMGDLTDPQSLNRYAYARNNPNKYTDPDGHWLWLAFGAINAAANAVIYLANHRNDGNLRDFLITTGVGFVGGAIGGGVAGNAVIQGLSTVSKIVVSAVTTTMISAPVTVATEMVAQSITKAQVKKPKEVLQSLTIVPAISSGMGAIATALPEVAGKIINPIYKEIAKVTATKVAIEGAKSISRRSSSATTQTIITPNRTPTVSNDYLDACMRRR